MKYKKWAVVDIDLKDLVYTGKRDDCLYVVEHTPSRYRYLKTMPIEEAEELLKQWNN
jgi:hypothetical protein